MQPARLKSWWSIDQRVFEANAHKLPKLENPETPAYLRQTCAALLKRRTFKRRDSLSAQKRKLAVAIGSDSTVSNEEAMDQLSSDEPESSETSSQISCPEMPEATSKRLVRSWPVRARAQPESRDSIASAEMEANLVEDEHEPNDKSAACRQSHPAIEEFKELLANLRGRRPTTVADLAESLEILWCKGSLADIGNLDRLWSIVVANPEIDLGSLF